MYSPNSHPWTAAESLSQHLTERGVSRRDFLEFCSGLAAVLGLPDIDAKRIARTLDMQKRPSVVWI
ncbi:MAG: twin-arginine translocation signal domain-containing protein, partial [Gemmatimonadota bacterium]